jgi:hypothetical protein
MNDDLRLLGILTDPPDPSLPTAPLSQEIRIAADQLAGDLMNGTLGMLLGPADRGHLIHLSLAMACWGDRAEALEGLARPPSRRERRRWWRRITWRVA